MNGIQGTRLCRPTESGGAGEANLLNKSALKTGPMIPKSPSAAPKREADRRQAEQARLEREAAKAEQRASRPSAAAAEAARQLRGNKRRAQSDRRRSRSAVRPSAMTLCRAEEQRQVRSIPESSERLPTHLAAVGGLAPF